jgi:hypothetical protein
LPWWLLLILLTVVVAGVLMIYIHIPGSHAYDRHGQDAVDAQRCVRDVRAWRVFVEVDTGRVYHLLCVISELQFYDLILAGIDHQGGEPSSYRQITAYLVDRGKYPLATLYAAWLLTRSPHRCIEIDASPFQNLPINFGP